jgi:hypothetical protein
LREKHSSAEMIEFAQHVGCGAKGRHHYKCRNLIKNKRQRQEGLESRV